MANLKEEVSQAIAAAQQQAVQQLRELALERPDTTVAEFVGAMGNLGASISVAEFLGVAAKVKAGKKKARKSVGKKKARKNAATQAAPAKAKKAGRKGPSPRQTAEEKAAYQLAILTALKTAGEAVSAKNLRAEVGGDPNIFLNTAKQMIVAGSIKAIGERAQRAYDLV